MNLIFHQINIRDLSTEINYVETFRCAEHNMVIGLEITHKPLMSVVDINIDPQHNQNFSKIEKTCVEETLSILTKNISLKNKHNILIILLKSDLDSIAAAAIIELFFQNKIDFNDDDIQSRINAIANYDRHSRDWKKINLNQFSKIKIPRGLFLLVSGWKNSIMFKIEMVKEWILTGYFNEMESYNNLASTNFHESIITSKIEMIIPKKVVFVKSTKRGACGIGYQTAPVVLAMNPSFRFGLGDSRVYGRKWIVAQCNNQFINMEKLLNLIKQRESNWGGSDTIIGSPQDRPSKIKKNDLIKMIKYVLKNF